MRSVRIALIGFILVWTTAICLADGGPVGVYAVVQKVVFEPSEEAPTLLQVWGVFVWVDGGLDHPGPINLPRRGYMYFKLPASSSQANTAKKQWAAIKAAAGTTQVIGFGNWEYAGPFEDLYIPAPNDQEQVRVRRQAEAPAQASTYPLKPGLVKIANDSKHADLYNLMKAFVQR